MSRTAIREARGDAPPTTVAPTAVDTIAEPGPSALEARYRRVLRVLPKPYRAAREQQRVQAFLDRRYRADPENADLTARFQGVGIAERMSVLALALRLRWADASGPERYRVRLVGVRVGLFAILTLCAVGAVTRLLNHLWLAVWPIETGGFPAGFPAGAGPSGFLYQLDQWAFVLWIPTFALAVRGGRACTWWAAALAVVPVAVTFIDSARQPGPSLASWALSVVDIAVLAGLVVVAVSGARIAIPHLRAWIVTAICALAVLECFEVWILLASAESWHVPEWVAAIAEWVLVDRFGLWAVALLIVVMVFAVRSARYRTVTTEGLLGLAWFAGATAVIRIGTVLAWLPAFRRPWDSPATSAAAGIVAQLVLSAVISVTAGILAVRRIRRLPRVRYSYAAGPPSTA